MARIIILLLFAITAQAVDFRWTVSSQNTETNKISLYQGETLRISVMLQSYSQGISTNGTSAEFLYRTNSVMGWWTIPATVTNGRVLAVFSPTNDVGALRYEWFIRFQDDGINYRVTGIITMIPSPGFVPNELPRPVYRIDFDAIEYLNAPWATFAILADAQSNTLSAAEVMIQESYSNALAAAYAEGWLSYTNSTLYSAILASNIAAAVAHSGSNYVDQSIAAIPQPTILVNPTNSNQWVSIASNAMTIYTRSVVSNLWSYHCGGNEVPEYPGVSWAPYPQDGTFFAPAPPLGSYGEIITPIVGNTDGTYFRFWWSSGIYRLSYPGDFPQVLAIWETNVLHGSDVDVYIRWLGGVITTNATSLQLFSKDELTAHNADTNAHSYIQLRIDELPTEADLATTLQASKDYTAQYVLDTLNDADLATLTAVGILIGNHNTDAAAHADIRAALTNIPAQIRIPIINSFSTNQNSVLYLSGSNGALRVQEVIP